MYECQMYDCQHVDCNDCCKKGGPELEYMREGKKMYAVCANYKEVDEKERIRRELVKGICAS